MAHKTYNAAGEKFCSICKIYHPINEFGKSKSSKDGYSYVCSLGRRKRLGGTITEAKPIKVIPVFTKDIAPILFSQMNYRYTRPDSYDQYLQSLNK